MRTLSLSLALAAAFAALPVAAHHANPKPQAPSTQAPEAPSPAKPATAPVPPAQDTLRASEAQLPEATAP